MSESKLFVLLIQQGTLYRNDQGAEADDVAVVDGVVQHRELDHFVVHEHALLKRQLLLMFNACTSQAHCPPGKIRVKKLKAIISLEVNK